VCGFLVFFLFWSGDGRLLRVSYAVFWVFLFLKGVVLGGGPWSWGPR